MGSFLVGRSQKRYNRPVEVCCVGLNDKTLVGSATFDQILKLYCGLIHRYIVRYFCNQKATSPSDYNHKIKGLVGSQNGANIHLSVPTSLEDPGINLYTSVVDFIYFRRLMESPLKGPVPRADQTHRQGQLIRLSLWTFRGLFSLPGV